MPKSIYIVSLLSYTINYMFAFNYYQLFPILVTKSYSREFHSNYEIFKYLGLYKREIASVLQ